MLQTCDSIQPRWISPFHSESFLRGENALLRTVRQLVEPAEVHLMQHQITTTWSTFMINAVCTQCAATATLERFEAA